MRCPSCNASLAVPIETCSSCGFTFDEGTRRFMTRHAGLVKEVEQLASVMDKLQIAMHRLSARVVELGQDLPGLRATPAQAPASQENELEFVMETQPEEPFVRHTSASSSSLSSSPARKETKTRDRVLSELALGQKWLLILGLVATVFGIGYFLKYSFDQGWVGPAGRVAMAYLTGLGLLGGGEIFRRRSYDRYGTFLMGGGIAVFYFSSFAGFQFYHLLGQIPAFLLMILTTALAVGLALVYDTVGLAVIGLIGGFLTPVMLSTGQDNYLVLFSYMTVLNLGLLWTAFHKRWALLHWLGFIATYALFTSWYAWNYTQRTFWPAVLFLNLFFIIYTLAPFAAHLSGRSSGRFTPTRLTVTNSFVAFGLTYAMIGDRFSTAWAGVASLTYAMIFLVLATVHRSRLGQDHPGLKLLLGNAALFIALTVPIVFSGHWITAFWALQAAVMLWLAKGLHSRFLLTGSWILIGMALAKLLGMDYPELFGLDTNRFAFIQGWDHLLLARATAVLTVLASLFAMAELCRRSLDPELALLPGTEKNPPQDAAILFGVFGVTLFAVATVEVNGMLVDLLPGGRFAGITALWTVFAAGLMILGFRLPSASLRWVSLGLFGITVLKVFTLDIVRFATPYRILSFIVLGLILVACSFLYYRYRERISELTRDSSGGAPS